MNGFNKVYLGGNLDSKPDLKFTQGGKPVATAFIKVVTEWEGKRYEKTFEVQAFNDVATQMSELESGAFVIFSGSLGVSTWQDKRTGEDRRRQGVIVNSIDASLATEASQAPAPPARAPSQPSKAASKPAAAAAKAKHNDDGLEDDDVPF